MYSRYFLVLFRSPFFSMLFGCHYRVMRAGLKSQLMNHFLTSVGHDVSNKPVMTQCTDDLDIYGTDRWPIQHFGKLYALW